MKSIITLLFCLLFLTNISFAQSNYSQTNFRFLQSTYTDISSTGNAIPMSNAESGVSTTPQNIGFNFIFNGTSFTQFMIHADGILQLGTTAPGAATDITVSPANSHAAVFTSTAANFQNVLLPFFTNLVKGATDPEFYVQVSGTAPNRVCTIQWKNLRDADNESGGTQHQFASLEFQVKLHETTNDIEFVYGNWATSAGTIPAFQRNAATGIKANSTSFLALYRPVALTNFEKAELLTQPNFTRYGFNGQPFTKLKVPAAGFTIRHYGRIANDVSVAKLYLDQIIPAGNTSAGTYETLVRNEGTNPMNNIAVTLQISGINTHTATVNIATLAAGAEQLVTFPSVALPNKGQQSVQVSLTADNDERSANNSIAETQTISTGNVQVYDYEKRTPSGVGFNNTTGFLAVKIFGSGTRKVSQIRIPFISYRNQVTVRIYEDGGAGGSPSSSPLFTSSSFLTTNEQDIIIPVSPAVTVDGDYYVAVQQQTTANMGWVFGINTPLRLSRTYTSTLGSTWVQQIANTLWQNLLQVYEETTGPDVGIELLKSPVCDYSTTAEVKVSLRNFSNQPIDFSITPTTITGFVQQPVTNVQFPFTIQKNSGTLAAGASEEMTVLTGYNFSFRGRHVFNVRTNLAGDVETGNDSLLFVINNNISVTRNISTPVCPLTEITLTGPSTLANLRWTVNNFISSGTTLTVKPTETTKVYISGVDYRGCLLQDSLILEVSNNNLPPRPVLLFGDTVLSHKQGFRDTIRVNSLPGHSVLWLGGMGTVVADTALVLNQVVGLNGARIAAAYTRTSDGCSNLSDTIIYSYGPGVLFNSNTLLTVCDTSFYDAGGPNNIHTGGSFTRTFAPATSGTKIKFSLYGLEVSNFAILEVFDGNSTSSPRIEAVSGNENGTTIREFIASNESGVLTIRFTPSGTSLGWWGGLTCHYPEIYRTTANGNWTDAAIWEKKMPGGTYTPAGRIPQKGDDSIYVRHNVLLNTSILTDQVVVESSGHLRIESPTSSFISIHSYKTKTQPEFLVYGTLTTNSFVQLFGENGFMEVKGNLANAGKIELDSILFTGTSQQHLGAAGTKGILRNLRLSNLAGLTLQGHQEVSSITFDQGIIQTTNQAMITFTSEGRSHISGARDAAHINGPAGVRIFGTGERFYPIGRNGLYRPVALNNSNTSSFDNDDELIAEVIAGAPASRTLPTGVNAVSSVRHYRLSRNGNFSSDFTITLPYGTDDGVTDPANLTLVKDDGAGGWVNLNGTASGAAPGVIVSETFNGMGDFVLANQTGGSNGLVTSVVDRLFERSNYVRLFPNPVVSNLTLEFDQSLSGQKLEIRLLDIQGRMLKKWSFANHSTRRTLWLGDLPPGNYMLEITNDQFRKQITQIVKQ